MNHGTFVAFAALNARLDKNDLTMALIATTVAAIALELSEDAEVKLLAASLKDHVAGLQKAIKP